jgi:hypothetical protein
MPTPLTDRPPHDLRRLEEGALQPFVAAVASKASMRDDRHYI